MNMFFGTSCFQNILKGSLDMLSEKIFELHFVIFKINIIHIVSEVPYLCLQRKYLNYTSLFFKMLLEYIYQKWKNYTVKFFAAHASKNWFKKNCYKISVEVV